MSASLKINTALADEQKLQRLLAKQAEIQAEIAALLQVPSSTAPPSSNQFHRSPIHKQQQRRQSDAPQSIMKSKSNDSGYGPSMSPSTSRSRSRREINANSDHVPTVRKSTPAQQMRKSSATVSEGKYQINEVLPLPFNPEIPFSCQSSQFMTNPGTYEGVGALKGEYKGAACDRNFCFLPLSPKPENKPENYPSLPRQDTNEKQVVSSLTPTYPLEKSVSRETLSSYSDDETEWDEDELSPNPPNLVFFQRTLVERVMDQFWKIFNQENKVTNLVRNNTVHYDYYCQTTSPTDEGDNRSSRVTTVSPTETQTPSQGTPARNERKRSRDSQDNQDDNDDERSSKRRRTLFSPPVKEDDKTKFACPYRKHNPRKYCVRDWRPCALTPLDTVAQVKSHLYRHHRIFPCQRCKELFEDQDQVSEHLKRARACELRDTLQADGVTSDIVEKLRSRKRAHKDQTEVEKWQDIYKLLFPNGIVPSPYFEPVQEDTAESPDFRALDDYEEYCRQELPRYVRVAVEEAVRQEQPIENIIGSQLMNIIRRCQGQVYSRYRSSAAPATSPALRNPVKSTSPTARPPSIRTIIDNSAEFIKPLGTNLEPPIRTYLERPLPQTHLESGLESSTSEPTTFKPVGQTSSPDSGYVSNGSTIPVAPSEGLSQTVPELPDSNPHSKHSYSTIEEPSPEKELSQNEFGFYTEPRAQEPYDPFGGGWNMSNTDGGSWFGDFDPTVPDGTDWTVYTDDLGFPRLYY